LPIEALSPIETLWRLSAALGGLIVGSFANVCIHRIPRGESIVAPRSRCPACHALIRAQDNVPILSYLFLLGRCRVCRVPISPRYPLVEAANGLLYWAVALMLPPGAVAGVIMLFLTALLVLSLIDLEHYILPDVITLPGIVVAIAASFLPGWHIAPREAVLGAAGAYATLAVFGLAYEKIRGVEGLGQGDWKMAAMLAALLGWRGALLTLLLASVAGTVVGVAVALWQRSSVRQQRIPLGTFLGLAGIVVIFVGSRLLTWYAGLWYG
jgi:leader peptidase (prepilin peptidase) / N-methyltransferase